MSYAINKGGGMKGKESKYYFLVGVFWPKEGGYGVCQRYADLGEAEGRVSELKRLGYGKKKTGNVSEIHLIRCKKNEVLKRVTHENYKEEQRA